MITIDAINVSDRVAANGITYCSDYGLDGDEKLEVGKRVNVFCLNSIWAATVVSRKDIYWFFQLDGNWAGV